MRRILVLLVSLALLGSAVVAGTADAQAKKKPLPKPYCLPQTLVLSAMPVELSAVLARLDRDPAITTKTIGGHDYYFGRYHHRQLVLTLTGIGPVNARHAIDNAFAAFPCGRATSIGEVVFSGVAGGDYIGDVIVPIGWTYDRGFHVYPANRRMLNLARSIAWSTAPKLLTTAPAGDPACGCVTSPDAVTTVPVTHKPVVKIGGLGQTTDPFTGRALPCVPGGGDVFGCVPCAANTDAQRDGPAFASGVVPFADPAFFSAYGASSATDKGYVVEDEETAVVAGESFARGVPFLGFRAVSDGGGDPLMLPGFPAQFFFYRQLAADNAAIATLAYLAAGG